MDKKRRWLVIFVSSLVIMMIISLGAMTVSKADRFTEEQENEQQLENRDSENSQDKDSEESEIDEESENSEEGEVAEDSENSDRTIDSEEDEELQERDDENSDISEDEESQINEDREDDDDETIENLQDNKYIEDETQEDEDSEDEDVSFSEDDEDEEDIDKRDSYQIVMGDKVHIIGQIFPNSNNEFVFDGKWFALEDRQYVYAKEVSINVGLTKYKAFVLIDKKEAYIYFNADKNKEITILGYIYVDDENPLDKDQDYKKLEKGTKVTPIYQYMNFKKNQSDKRYGTPTIIGDKVIITKKLKNYTYALKTVDSNGNEKYELKDNKDSEQ